VAFCILCGPLRLCAPAVELKSAQRFRDVFPIFVFPKIRLALMTTCKNCNTEFEGKFCPNCSQKAATKRFTLGHFAYDVFHAVTHTDKGILFLIKELFRRPGHVAEEYNVGQRKKYFNPVTYMLLISALMIYGAQKTNIYDYYLSKTQELIQKISKNTKSSDLNESLETLENAKAQQKKVMENNKILTLIFLPLLSLLTWLFFYKSGHNYAENLVLNVMIQAQLYLVFIVCIGLFLIAPWTIMFTMYLYLVFTWLFSIIAYRQFFKQRWGWTLLKGSTLQIIYVLGIQEISKIVVQYL
jgi:hypothetical protein